MVCRGVPLAFGSDAMPDPFEMLRLATTVVWTLLDTGLRVGELCDLGSDNCPTSREGGLQRGQIEYQIVAVLQAIQKAPRIIPHLSIHPDSGRNRPPKTSIVQPTTIANPVGNNTVFT
jgi:hypothetical protein